MAARAAASITKNPILNNLQEITRDSCSAEGKDSSQFVFYGFTTCWYESYKELLEKHGSIVFLYKAMADFDHKIEIKWTDRLFIKMEIPLEKSSDRLITFKAGLVNAVVENFFRKRNGIPLLPVVFCMDCEDNPHSTDPTTFEKNITFSEIKRAYKLCFDPSIPDEVKEVAKRTFTFIKTAYVPITLVTGETKWTFLPPSRTKATWEHEKWGETDFMKKREGKEKAPSQTYWRKHVCGSILGTHLLEAVQKNDLASFTSLLARGGIPFSFYVSALIEAIKENRVEIFNELIESTPWEEAPPVYIEDFLFSLLDSTNKEILSYFIAHRKCRAIERIGHDLSTIRMRLTKLP